MGAYLETQHNLCHQLCVEILKMKVQSVGCRPTRGSTTSGLSDKIGVCKKTGFTLQNMSELAAWTDGWIEYSRGGIRNVTMFILIFINKHEKLSGWELIFLLLPEMWSIPFDCRLSYTLKTLRAFPSMVCFSSQDGKCLIFISTGSHQALEI